MLVAGCLLENPLQETPAPDEYAYNYWLLERLYLYPERLQSATGLAKTNLTPDSAQIVPVQNLYKALGDPHTTYTLPEKAQEVQDGLTHSVAPGSLGWELLGGNDSLCPLQVFRVYPHSPAAEAGAQRYDCLLTYNDVNLLTAQARGLYDSIFTATVRAHLYVRRGNDTLELRMEKRTVAVPTVFLDTVNGVPLVQIRRFVAQTLNGAGTAAEFRQALEATSGAAGRIISVVGNPGGDIRQCLDAADEVVEEGRTLSRMAVRRFDAHGRSHMDSVVYTARAGGAGERQRMVLLIGASSASCAEIFAAALSQGAHVPLVGERTYGKGVGQSMWNTPAGALALITNLSVLTPRGEIYHGKGLEPDVAVAQEGMLDAALNLLHSNLPRRAGFAVSPDNVIFREWAAMQPTDAVSGAWLPGETEK